MAKTIAADPLAPFSPAVRAWFEASFEAPTEAQTRGWEAIARGEHTLIHAPTGSGKTLAAFLYALDRLARDPSPEPTRADPGHVRVLYVSPLKALTYDVERNLRAPLTGIGLAAQKHGDEPPRITVASRTGDTPTEDRREIARHPPDILITTPESLYLLLTSQAREILRAVEHVIIDEVHAIAGTKRGAHLALTLERLEHLRDPAAGTEPPQRIGLSATQRPLDTIARFLGGIGPDREVTIVDAGTRKPLELEVVVPVDDMAALGEVLPQEQQPGGPAISPEARSSIWPAIHPRILELIRSHKSTIVFTNSRRLSERLAQRLNELAGEDLVRAHHGSIAREQRLEIEEELKAGRLPALVATSSLELGIDMGAVDLVIQVESPTSVARGLQRVGRAGHQVGAPSKGVIFPKYRGDLLEVAVVTRRMHEGEIEQTRIPRNPLDVLAQQLVAMTVMDRWTGDDLYQTAIRAAPYETLTREMFDGVLGMLAGAYPSDEFAELKPRLVWDRVTDTIEGRRDARVVAVTSGGTIPDRGLFGVFMEGEAGTPGRRVGELDEEMVYELRAGMHGDVIILGASSWRVQDIGHDRVTVTPAPGVPGKLPFWKGDAVGRPIELGRALGAFVGEIEGDLARGATGRAAASQRLRDYHDLDERAAENLLSYLEDERDSTGALPTDRRVVVERFRDELGDWRLTLLTPFGGRVHAPWSLAIEARLADRLGLEVQTIWSDDGIAIRMPEGEGSLDGIEELLFPSPEDVEDLVVGQVANSALFASRFRENAARALLLPRRRPGTRTPLWQQRQRAADLLAVASRYGSFPILVETYRECLSDVFDLDALRDILGGVASREIAVHGVETPRASPFASSLLFDYVAAYMYEGDAPLAERRAGALTLDRDLLRELLGQEELRELLDPEALADLELTLQALTDERQATTVDQVHDLLRRLGDLSNEEIAARVFEDRATADAWLGELATNRRAVKVRIAREDRWIAIEDAARYRDGVGVTAPVGVPEAFLAPAANALDGLLARYARTHGPFLTPEPAARWGLPIASVDEALERLHAAGTILRGEFRPGGAEREWCDPDVLRLLRRRSLARLRREVEPVDPAALGRFLPAWHGIAPVAGPGADPPVFRGSAALERLAEVVDQLAGVAIPASVLERDVLPARDPGLRPAVARRARRDGRGRLDRARQPGPRRRPHRAVPPRSGGDPAGRPDRRQRRPYPPTHRRAPRPGPRAPAQPWRQLLPCHPRGRRRRLGPRDARCAVGPGLGRRGHQRHVRATSGAALEAAVRLRSWGAARTAKPPDRAWPAGGRGSLVAGRTGRGGRSDGTTARPGARTPGAAWGADPRGGRGGGARGRVRRHLPGPPSPRGGGSDPARLLRRRARSSPVRAGRGARPAARGTRGRGGLDRPGRACPRRRGSGEPVRGGAAMAAARRRRPTPVPTGSRRLCRDGGRDRGAVPRTWRLDAPDAAGGGPARGRRGSRAGPGHAGRRRSRPRAAHPQGRRRGGRRFAAAPGTARRRVRGRVSRTHAAQTVSARDA